MSSRLDGTSHVLTVGLNCKEAEAVKSTLPVFLSVSPTQQQP